MYMKNNTIIYLCYFKVKPECWNGQLEPWEKVNKESLD